MMKARAAGLTGCPVRTVAYALASALSATLLVLSVPRGHALPADAGYSTAALASIVILAAALAVSLLFAMLAANPGSRGTLGHPG